MKKFAKIILIVASSAAAASAAFVLSKNPSGLKELPSLIKKDGK